MPRADWTARERKIIDSGYRMWKMSEAKSRCRGVVSYTAMQCGDITGDPETWDRSNWAQQIRRYYANRKAAEYGRPKAHMKTREQLALLRYAFDQTSGHPYAGEVLPLAFLSGLEVKQVKAWFSKQREKPGYDDDDDDDYDYDDEFPSPKPPRVFRMRAQDPQDAGAMTRQFNNDPEGYARSLVMWERCVRTGRPGPFEEMQRPRPYFKKYWTRMFPGDGEERSLLEVTEELEGSGDDSVSKLTKEEVEDMMTQSRIEARQFETKQREEWRVLGYTNGEPR